MPDDLFVAGIEGSMSATASRDVTPAVLRASLVAPYVDGVLFVHALRRRGIARGGADPTGWSEVDRVWKSLPETLPAESRQPLHPRVQFANYRHVIAKLGLEALSKGPHKVGLRALIESAQRVVALTDATKVGQERTVRFADLEDIDVLVTDEGGIVGAGRKQNVEVRPESKQLAEVLADETC